MSNLQINRACDHEVEFHPLANLFPLLEGVEFEQLVEDIKTNGQLEAIVLLDHQILDGRNRYRACLAAGIEPRFTTAYGGDDPAAYVISVNIRRRHLNREQQGELLIKVIAAAPEKSDRQIAKTIGVDHKTIGAARAKGEDVGRIPHVNTRTDTKGRKQPAKKGSPPQDQIETVGRVSSATRLRESLLEAHARIRELETENSRLRNRITVLEGAETAAHPLDIPPELRRAGR